jgi:hypothetical protein
MQVIYLFYPETKSRALEDMDALFGRTQSAVSAESDEEDAGTAYEDDPLPLSRRGSREIGGSVRLGSSGREA